MEETPYKIVLVVMGFFMFKKALLALIATLLSFQVMASGSALINGKEIKNREQLDSIFVKQLKLAPLSKTSLFNSLSTDYSGDTIIKIKHVNLLKAKLGPEYIDSMVQAIIDAADDNQHIILVIE